MDTSHYGMHRSLRGTSVAEARKKVEEALKAEGFGVLTEIDVKATLKKKLDKDFRDYVILGACNPNLAYEALQGEPWIGLLLPCNVVLQATPDGCAVGIADPESMFRVVENPRLQSLVREARQRLSRVLESL